MEIICKIFFCIIEFKTQMFKISNQLVNTLKEYFRIEINDVLILFQLVETLIN